MGGIHQVLMIGTHPDNPDPIVDPDDVAGLILNLEADALGLSDNDTVTTWTDSSLEGNDATQATPGSKPVFKTNQLNGLPIVRFDGSNDFMTVAGFTKGAFTAFYVYKSTFAGILLEHSVNAGSNFGDYHYVPGGAHFAANGATGFSAYDLSAPSLAVGTFRYITRKMDGTHAGHLAWVNGVAGTRTNFVGTGDPGTGDVTADLYIGGRAGASLFNAGDYAQIIIFDNAISEPNRVGIEAFLADKWGL